MASKFGYKLKNMFKSKEQIELEARMMFNKQQREFNQYNRELDNSIRKYEKMAKDAALSGNHQNAQNCARFVLKLRKTQTRVQGLLQRFEMMHSMQRLSGVMSNFMSSCAEMGLNMDATINLKDMWKNTAMMEQSLAKLDAMTDQMDMVFNAIDNGLQESGADAVTDEEADAEAAALLDDIMKRHNVINSVPTAVQTPSVAQTDPQLTASEAPAEDDVNERIRKMMQELKD